MDDHTRIRWSDISAAARKTSEDLNGKDWIQAGIKARVLLADLADVVDRLKADRSALLAACREMVTHCLCGGQGQVVRKRHDAASGEMEWDGFDDCDRCKAARAVIARATKGES